MTKAKCKSNQELSNISSQKTVIMPYEALKVKLHKSNTIIDVFIWFQEFQYVSTMYIYRVIVDFNKSHVNIILYYSLLLMLWDWIVFFCYWARKILVISHPFDPFVGSPFISVDNRTTMMQYSWIVIILTTSIEPIKCWSYFWLDCEKIIISTWL